MAVLSVDLANKSYADIGAVVLRHERDHIRAERLRVEPTGAPLPDVLAAFLNEYCEKAAIRILLLDGPQGWMAPATGLAHSRRCERELNTPAKTGLPGSVKPANYLGWVTFSIAVFDALTSRGWERLPSRSPITQKAKVLIESFPLSAWRALNLTPLPAKRKCKKQDLDDCFAALKAIVPLQMSFVPNHDELQALVAGFAGLAVERNDWQRCAVAGLPPTMDAGSWREGFIVNPTRAVFKSVGTSVVPTDGQSACERPEPVTVEGASSQRQSGRRSVSLIKSFRAKFRNGRIEPREPVVFSEEAELIVTAEEVETRRDEATEGIWTGYDSKAVDEALRETAGSWSDIDPDAVVAAIYRAREEGTRPPSRP